MPCPFGPRLRQCHMLTAMQVRMPVPLPIPRGDGREHRARAARSSVLGDPESAIRRDRLRTRNWNQSVGLQNDNPRRAGPVPARPGGPNRGQDHAEVNASGSSSHSPSRSLFARWSGTQSLPSFRPQVGVLPGPPSRQPFA